MDEITDGVDPHDEIERLEDQIEQLAAKIESCRKFALLARVAMALGAVVLLVILFGAVRFDPAVMGAAIAAGLGGIVLAGSNGSTAREAAAQLVTAEASRAALIGLIELRTVSGVDGAR